MSGKEHAQVNESARYKSAKLVKLYSAKVNCLFWGTQMTKFIEGKRLLPDITTSLVLHLLVRSFL